jgi:hypothetical protein
VLLFAVRHILPAVVTLAGILVMAIGGDSNSLEGGAAIVGAGLAIWLMNFLWRIGVTGDRERTEEDEARAFFDEHGRWPDEPESQERPLHQSRPPHGRPPHGSPRSRRP